MKISIVTPTFNRTRYLDNTIESIVTQKGDFDLEYIIQDGGSSEELIHTLKKWDERIKENKVEIGCNSLEFRYFSERDQGMYDAINKGFARSTGEVMAWLNSDDLYHPYALQTVAQIFQKHDTVAWVTGIPNSFNKFGSRSGFDSFPPAYSRKFIKDGCYRLSCHGYSFNWIQQESTFWRRDLWKKVGSRVDAKYKYAADFYLWQKFAQHADLVKINSFLGGFRVHDDQLTADPDSYNSELPLGKSPPMGLKVLHLVLRRWPSLRTLFFNKWRGVPLLNILGLRSENLVGRTVTWSFDEQEWAVRFREIV